MSKRKTIIDYLEICLSNDIYWDDINFPITTHLKTWWRCKVCGHRWLSTYHAINDKRRHGCPGCKSRKTTERNKTWIRTEETRRKMSIAKMGQVISLETRRKLSEAGKGKRIGKENPMYKDGSCSKQNYCMCGEKISFKAKECMSCYHKRNKGDKHLNWNPSLTDEDRQNRRLIPDYRNWAYLVKERDSFTCQICGQEHGDIISHHLESYRANPDLRTSIENGVCLCETCHKNFHHQYGYGDNTKEQFEEFKCERVYAQSAI